MSSYKKLAKNTFWFALGNFGSKTISFIMIPLYTAMLSTEVYGKLDLLTTTVSLLVPLLTVQVADAVLRFGIGAEDDKEEAFTNSLLVVVIGIIVSLALYPLLALSDIFNQYIIYFYAILWMSMTSTLFKFFLRVIDKVKLSAIGDIAYTFSFVLLNILLLVKFRMGIEGYFLSMVIGFIIMNLYIFFRGELYKYIDLGKLDKKKLKIMVLYSIPLVPNTLNWWIMNVSDRYIVTYFLGLSATGLYAISYKLPSIISILNSIFYSSWQVSAIEEFNSEDRNKFYSVIFDLNFTLIILMVSGLLLLLKPIYSVWVAPDYFIAWRYSPFLILGVGISAFSSFYGVGYLATKNTIRAFYTSIFGSIVNVVINVLLIPYIGLQAAAVSTLAAYVVMWLVRLYETRNTFRIKLNYKRILISLALVLGQIFFLLTLELGSYITSIVIFSLLVVVNKSSMAQLVGTFKSKITGKLKSKKS